MKYTITINQKAVIENGWSILKANHIAVLDVITSMSVSRGCVKMNDGTGEWFWVAPKLIISQLPMFEIKERRCTQLIDDLVICGLIEKNQGNQKYSRTYLRIGVNYEKLMYSKSDDLSKNATPMQNIAEVPVQYFSDLPVQNIADYKYIKDKYINDNILNGVKTQFVKPTLPELQAEFEKKVSPRAAEMNAQNFINHYETVGWIVGKNRLPMKNWKSAVAGWVSRIKEDPKNKNPNDMSRYDYSDNTPQPF